MSFSVLNNMAGIAAQNELITNNFGLQTTLNRISSGRRINTGADDAAGLAIADGLRGQINALNQAYRNASDGIGYLQVADGAMAQITTLLHRGVSLAEQAATSTNSAQLLTISSEYEQIKSEINRIQGNTYYNGVNVFSTALTIFVGDTTSTSTIAVTTTNWKITSSDLLGGASSVSRTSYAQNELAKLKTALSSVSGYRGEAGSYVNRLRAAQGVIMAQSQNLTAAESGIRDANMAEEVSNLTKFQILNQAGMSALAQANSQAQNVLSLFR